MSDGIAETLGAMRPEAVALAETVSFAVLVDRPLLRQARMQLVPEADAGAEADVWLSDLVKSRSRDGITFTPEAAAALRARLAGNAGRAEEAWKLTMAMHDHLPPTLKLEEKINRLSIDASEEAAREIDELLSSVLAAMTSGGRDGVASWAARALATFPTSVRKRPAARMLAAGATLRLGGDPRASFDGAMPEWLRFVAPPDLPMANVGVQLANRLLRLDASESPAGQILRLPATAPYLIDVTWTLGNGSEDGHQIALRPGDVQHFPVDADEIRLRTVNGDVYGLRAGGTTPAEVLPYIIDFSEVLDRPARWRMQYAQELALRVSPPITILTGPEGSGKTTTLAQVVRRIQASETACVHHFFERGTPQLQYWDFAQRSLIAQLMTRYDAPSWAITMTLFEFLRLLEPRVGTGPVYLVLDNVDVIRGFEMMDLLGSFMNLPPQFVFLTSSTFVPEQFDREAIEVVPLEASPTEAPPRLPDRGSSARRYLEALAVARAPLPLEDADRLRASVDLTTLDIEPWTQRRSNVSEPSITIAGTFLRSTLREALAPDGPQAHRQLARAVSLDHEDESWYGLYHGAWHWLMAGEDDVAIERLTSTRGLEKLIGHFGTAITADVIDEIGHASVRDVTESRFDARRLEIVSTALRANLQRVNEAPGDVAAILYSALRRDRREDDEIEELLGLRPMDLPLRIASDDAQPSKGARLRPPSPVAAIHMDALRGTLAVRCTNAVMLVDPSGIATTIRTLPLTASSLGFDGQLAVIGDAEGTVTFLSMPDGKGLERFEAHRGEVTHIVAADDALFSCGADGYILHWSLENDRPSIADRYTARVTSAVAFSGEAAFGCADGKIFEISRRGTTLRTKAHDGAVLAITRNAQDIYSAGADRKLRICPVVRPGADRTVDSGHSLGVTGLIAVPGRRSFVTSGDRTARLWEAGMNTRLLEHDAAITVATIIPGRKNEFLITGTADGSLYVWDRSGGLVRRQLRHGGAIRACAVHDDELITGGDDREIVRTSLDLVARPDASVSSCSSVAKALGICRGGTFNIRYDGGAGGVGGSIATSIALRPDGRRAVVWDRGARHVREWDVRGAKKKQVGPFGAGVVGAGYAGDVIAVALESGEVAFARGSGPVDVWPIRGGPITAMATNSSAIITVGIDGTIDVTSTAKSSAFGTTGNLRSRVTALAANDKFAVSGTEDGEVALWGLALRRPIFTFDLGSPISILAMALDGSIIVASDATLAILDPAGRERSISTAHRDRITALLVDERWQLIYTASLDRTVRAWDFQGREQGIVYGDHPFSVLALIHGNILPGEVLAGDDGGAVWTFSHRGGDLDADTPAVRVNRPLRMKASSKKASSKKTSKKKPASKKAFSKKPSSKKPSSKFSSGRSSSKKRKLK